MKRILVALLCMFVIAVVCACVDESNESSVGHSSESSLAVSETETSDEISDFSDAVSENESIGSSDVSVDTSEVSAESSENEISEAESLEESEPSEEISEEISEETSEETSDETSDESSKEEEVYTDIGDAELLPSGYLIYNGAAYSAAGYSPSNCSRYADVYNNYAELFPDTRITVINPPLSIISVKNPLVRALMRDQEALLDSMKSHIYGRVNFVKLKDAFVAHRGEYLYFKSDYHWTQLGAYYAYVEYAKSVGLTPTPLGRFEHKVITDTFIGRSNDYANDERINSFYDTVHAYLPIKSHTMTVYQPNGDSRKFKSCIDESILNYSCFTRGDNPFIVINVPENDPEKIVLVIKESSANAFVPFLTEHYGKIYVIDPRSLVFDIRSLVAEKGIDEIIFFSMASTANGGTYCDYYERMIGA